jgi:hypothetical protein
MSGIPAREVLFLAKWILKYKDRKVNPYLYNI